MSNMTYSISMSYEELILILENEAKARGLYRVAKGMKAYPKTLYRMFSGESDPSFKSVVSLCEFMEMEINIVKKGESDE